jgi:nucleoid-associated protein YgaU
VVQDKVAGQRLNRCGAMRGIMMAEGVTNGTRVILLLLGVGAVGGGYALWQANQRPPVAGADAPGEESAVAAARLPEPAAPEEAAPEPSASEPVAAAPAASELAVPEPAAPEPAATEPAAPPPAPPALPTFDVVRIEADGVALIAGTAPADARVSLRLDGVEEVRVQAGADGAFVAQLALPPNPAPRLLSMVAILADGTELAAGQTVAVAPVAALPPVAAAPEAAPEPAPPAAILLTDEGAEVIQGPTPVTPGEKTGVALDTIAYAPDGAVQLSGRGRGDHALRIYLDNAAVMDARTGPDGKWAVTLPDVSPGVYTLRIDQIAADGAVSSRFETPFKRETLAALAAASGSTAVPVVPAAEPASAPQAVAETAPEPAPDVAPEPAPEAVTGAAPETDIEVDPAPAPASVVPVAPAAIANPVIADAPNADPVVAEPVTAPVTVTVQPGFTLWGIATERFGSGTMYVQVFEANRDSIKNPDLIYPGQVFTLPQE